MYSTEKKNLAALSVITTQQIVNIQCLVCVRISEF